MTGDVLALLPELCLLTAAVVGLLVGLWLPRRRQWVVHGIASAALLGSVALALAATADATTAFHGTYSLDGITTAVRVVAPLATMLVLTMARDAIRSHRRETEHAVLLLLATLGAVLLAGAADLLVLTAAYLLATVPLIALAGLDRDGPGGEAAMKIMLLGAFCGVVVLCGVAVLYGLGGSTAYADLSTGLVGVPQWVVLIAALGVLLGLLFKSGAVPAHFWVPDAAQGSRLGVAAFLTTVPKLGGLAAVHRLVSEVVPGAGGVLVAVLAAASMTLGNLAAFRQDDLRRLLGYSTISQVGYLLIAPAAVGSGLSRSALLLYLAAYAVTNVGAFAVLSARPAAHGPDRWTGLFQRDRPLALALVVCLLGFVGTPPTAVFAGKLTVFAAGLDRGLAWLVVLAALNTVASLFYYLRWIGPLFREADGEQDPPASGGWARGTALVSAAVTLVLGVGAGAVFATLG